MGEIIFESLLIILCVCAHTQLSTWDLLSAIADTARLPSECRIGRMARNAMSRMH